MTDDRFKHRHVVCHDCGWEKEVYDKGTGVSTKKTAAAAKAGHLGGQRKHFKQAPCENVEIVEVDDD